jgi:hypothetical protein
MRVSLVYFGDMITDQDIQNIVDRMTDRFLGIFATKEDLKPIRADIARLDARVDDVFDILDMHTGMLEDLRMEYHSMGQQLSRHDRWIHQLGKKTDTMLSIEA